MKIAVLLGSPRIKDSYRICKEIETQINQRNDSMEFDYIHIKNYNVMDCKGCCLCFQKGENDCPCRGDDVNSIKERLKAADALIIASPVYAYHVTGQLKRFIDRTSYLFHRPELVGKSVIIVVTTDGSGSKQVFDYLKMTVSGWGLDLVGDLQIVSPWYFGNREPQGAFNYNPDYFEKNHKKIVSVSARLLERLKSPGKRTPSFYDIFMFNCLRSKTYTSRADYAYWDQKGWMTMDYFYDVPLNPAKRIFGAIIKGIVHRMAMSYLSSE